MESDSSSAGRLLFGIGTALYLLSVPHSLCGAETQPAASAEISEAPMIGMFYDLKQTQDHKPTTIDPTAYFHVIDEFLSKGWDESVLNHYYRSSKPIYTTQIYIPYTNSDLAPKVFGLEKEVKPALWIAYYKAQVSPPETGTYRFVGAGDDVIAVAIDGKTVLAAPLRDPTSSLIPLTKWKTSDPGGSQAGTGGENFCNGDWVTLKRDEPIDLEVMFGDCPGAIYSAFLMIEEKGKTYAMAPDHHPILPIFQVAPYNTPQSRGEVAPVFATGFPTWKCYQ